VAVQKLLYYYVKSDGFK